MHKCGSDGVYPGRLFEGPSQEQAVGLQETMSFSSRIIGSLQLFCSWGSGQDTVSLYSPSIYETHHVDQYGLELIARNLPLPQECRD